jgi:hypothetical protein
VFPVLARQQNLYALLHRIGGLLPQYSVAVVADGVGNDDKRVSGMPDTWAITCAVGTKRSVSPPPRCQPVLENGVVHTARSNCPNPHREMTASHPCIAASIVPVPVG